MIAQSGPALAPASLSARQAEQAGLLTSGTSGPTGSTSLRSAALQSSLESRLRRKTASVGSILYRLTWKERVTPSGRPICALRASAWSGKKAKPGNGYSGPFTIAAIPSSEPCFAILPVSLAQEISAMVESISGSDHILSGWPTPTTADASGGGQAKRAMGETRHGSNLNDFAMLTGWTTTTTRDHKDTPGMTAKRSDTGKDRNDQLPRQAYLTGWATPQVADVNLDRGSLAYRQKKQMISPYPSTALQATIAGPMRLRADGTLLTGSSAGMESGGQLDPAHSRWLMRLPPEWDACAPMATGSTRKPRQNSPAPFAKLSTVNRMLLFAAMAA